MAANRNAKPQKARPRASAKRDAVRAAPRPGASSSRILGDQRWTGAGGLVGAVSVVVALLAWLLPQSSQDDERDPAASNTPSPSATHALAPRASGNVHSTYLSVDNGYDDNAGGPARIVITSHNLGERNLVAQRVRLTLLDKVEISMCAGEGGEIPISGTYAALIPANLEVGDRPIDISLRQAEIPDGVGSFAVKLQLSPTAKDEGISSVYLFRFSVTLVTDGEPKEVLLGPVLVSLPLVLDPDDEASPPIFWGPVDEGGRRPLDFRPDAARIKRCMQENSSRIRNFMRLPGERSQELDLLDRSLR